MAQYAVLQDWAGQVDGAEARVLVGELVDDRWFDIVQARAGGIALIENTPDVNRVREIFLQSRQARQEDADFVPLLVDAGLIGRAGIGSGDVVGPSSAVDGEVALFDGTTGKTLRVGPRIGTGADQLVQLDSQARLPAVNGSQLTGIVATSTPSGPASGDLSGNYPGPTVAQLQSQPVSATPPTDQQVLTYDAAGSQWRGAPLASPSPVASLMRSTPVGAIEPSAVREETLRVVSEKSFECPRTSLFIGPNVRVFDVGEKLATEDMAQGDTYLVTLQEFDDAGSSRPESIDLSAVQLLSQQSDSTDIQTATVHTFAINDPAAVPEGITANAVFQLSSIPAASEPIRIELFLGTDDTGAVLLDDLFPPQVGSNTVDLPSPLTVRGSTDYFLRLSASTSFGVRGTDGPPFQLFYQLNGQVVTRRPLALQSEVGNALQLQGRVLAATAPSGGDAIVWNGTTMTWEPSAVSGSGAPTGPATGDLADNYPAPTVAGIRGRTVAATAPTNNQVYAWNATTMQFEPRDVSTLIASSPPALTNFHTSAPARVPLATDLGGQVYNATYDLDNAGGAATARLIGFPTGSPGSPTVIVADASRIEGSNLQSFTFPAGVDFTMEGNSYTLRLEVYTAGQVVGTDTPVASADQEIIAQAAQRGDVLYFGISPDNTPANVDVSTLASQTRLDGQVTLPTWADSQYVIFAYPDSAAAVTALTIGGVNQLAAFTLTAAAITVNSVSYSTLISTNLLLGSVASGNVITITR